MLHKATLGGVQGAADLQYRARTPDQRDWRGTFVFRANDEETIARLIDHGPTVFETSFEGETCRLSVMVRSFTPTGLAFFESVDEAH